MSRLPRLPLLRRPGQRSAMRRVSELYASSDRFRSSAQPSRAWGVAGVLASFAAPTDGDLIAEFDGERMRELIGGIARALAAPGDLDRSLAVDDGAGGVSVRAVFVALGHGFGYVGDKEKLETPD
jgi:hypothetical protein